MAFDYKKEYKEFYMPPRTPGVITIPAMNFLAVRGRGDPNEENGAYKQALELLYAVAYTIKMSKMGKHQLEGYFDYVVPPLEGLWWQTGIHGVDYARKKDFQWISLIHLPEFVTKEVFDWAIREAADKKQQDFSKVEFFSWEEGLCVQCMHMDPYDDEPATVAAMAKYARAQGYEADFREGRFHHEIYLSDVRRCKPERLKTVIRHPIKRAEQGETTMEIRKLRPTDDLFAVSRVYEESWREAYRGLLLQEYLDSIPLGKWVPYLGQAGRETLIILDGEKIIGAAGCCASRVPELAGWGEIASIYLLPKYWGKGWGKSLLSAAVEQLESMGYQDIFLWVLERNQRARAFYERMGFRPSGAYAEDAIGGLPVREIQYRLERTDSLCRLPR